jgi:hypothetical protein
MSYFTIHVFAVAVSSMISVLRRLRNLLTSRVLLSNSSLRTRQNSSTSTPLPLSPPIQPFTSVFFSKRLATLVGSGEADLVLKCAVVAACARFDWSSAPCSVLLSVISNPSWLCELSLTRHFPALWAAAECTAGITTRSSTQTLHAAWGGASVEACLPCAQLAIDCLSEGEPAG